MRPVSDRFLTALRGSHQMVVRVRVCAPGQTGTNPDGTEIEVQSGDVTLDGTADVRGTVDMTTPGHAMWPTKTDLLLAPYGNELFVERGIRFDNGHTERVALGYYRIDDIGQDQAPEGPITIRASDRMAGLIDAKLTSPRQFASSETYGNVVDQLVTDVYPDAVIVWDAGDGQTLGRGLIVEDDRWAFLNDLILGLGKIWYWDYQGRLSITDPPSSTSPVWEVNAGRGGVLLGLSRQLTRSEAYNGVVVSGEGTDTTTPVSYVAVDLDVNSPTYWYGGFGKKPIFFSDPSITTLAQATSAARTLLRRQIGLPYEINLSAIANPALEPWDPVKIRPRRGGPTIHVLASVTIPLTHTDPLTATSREQTTLRIGSL